MDNIIHVENENIGTRIDVFLSEKMDKSRASIQKQIESEEVLVNDKCIKSNYKLRENDLIKVFITEPLPLLVSSVKMNLDILYEDSEIIVINKEKGTVVHPAPGHTNDTLVNGLLHHCEGELSGINGVMRPGIVHRIDKDTSGVLVIAKTDFAHKVLSEQLKDHSMKRVYEAIAIGRLKEEQITVNAPIGRNPNDRLKMAVVKKGAKEAVTHIFAKNVINNYTHIEARLETGRTHQIRVHMAHIKHPLLGDYVYGSKNVAFKDFGQILHAKTLGFINPLTNKYLEFDTNLPDYFLKAIKFCEKK